MKDLLKILCWWFPSCWNKLEGICRNLRLLEGEQRSDEVRYFSVSRKVSCCPSLPSPDVRHCSIIPSPATMDNKIYLSPSPFPVSFRYGPLHKVLTYKEYRAVSGIFRNRNYWPPPRSTQRVCPLPHQRRGVHTRRAVRGWGVNISEDARHWIGLLQYNPSTVL